jgi:hypothetical protein
MYRRSGCEISSHFLLFLFFIISEGDFLSTKNYPLQLAELEFGFFPTSFQEFPITSKAERSLGGKPGRQRSGNRC